MSRTFLIYLYLYLYIHIHILRRVLLRHQLSTYVILRIYIFIGASEPIYKYAYIQIYKYREQSKIVNININKSKN